jgi:hypothetical protein
MIFEVLNGALGLMQTGPRPLTKTLAASASINFDGEDFDPGSLQCHLGEAPPGDDIASVFRRALAGWDNETDTAWAQGTVRNSVARRQRIYELLRLGQSFVDLCNQKFPFHRLDPPVVIATEHSRWYTDEVRRARSFYWTAYERQLAAQNWSEDSIRQLDESTTSVVERLSDPTAEAAYQSKGLVVGHVQSGKTANFTGVIAKAADAGYKLIIVLAGTMDVLRSQTQRRVDKDMIGRELLDRDYIADADWDRFLSHSAKPSELGSFDWYRLTGPESDYKKLGRGVEALKFEASDPTKPLWHRDNIFLAGTRIAIVKKNSKILERLLSDLRLLSRGRIGSPLDQVPALIIDDESDQASINVNKSPSGGAAQERTATNAAIVDLLRLLPRAQYVGYTATPFANVFVDPNNEEDIFPKDFLISLPRPEFYMGVSDFYDLDGSPSDEATRPNERDFVRSVKGVDTDPRNLERGIDSFVLTGALKLYREASDDRLKFRHHTMLAHSSARVADHEQLAAVVRRTFARAAYDGGPGIKRLEALLEEDFRRVSRDRESELPFPASFDELAAFVGECLVRIGDPEDAVLILNNENREQTPDFDRQPVWKILVGGTKLSRGYTVEGLTISYYRRRAQTADTLMQMGRWFGFRGSYRDLVRLYIGTEESLDKRGRRKINLYEAFGAICRDEEMFRDELKRYASMDEPRITPLQIPPLVPSHMLKPTATNKMYNARVTYRNFGGRLSESTFAPTEEAEIRHNENALIHLLKGKKIKRQDLSALVKGRQVRLAANTAVLSPAEVLRFLKSYRWFDRNDRTTSRLGNPMAPQIGFLEDTGDRDPAIDDWLLLAPCISDPRAKLAMEGVSFDVVYRSRHTEAPNRFNTYNDPIHRQFAEHIAMQAQLQNANAALDEFRRDRRAVIIFYPITEALKGARVKPPYTSGFTLLFPRNNITSPITFGVVRPDRPKAAVVPVQ